MTMSRSFVTDLRRVVMEPWPMDRVSLGLGVFGLLFIAAMAASIAWRDFTATERQARNHARSTAFVLGDHARRLFEVTDLALRATAASLDHEDWPAIVGSGRVRAEMDATKAALPSITDLWLNDAAGVLRMTTFADPAPPSTIADRPIFAALQQAGTSFVVGDRIVGRVTNEPTFLVARQSRWPDGRLRGFVSATANLSYFTDYWSRFDLENGEAIALQRLGADQVLARFPDSAGTAPDDAALRAAAARQPSSGTFVPADGMIGFYRQVADLPVYVTVTYAENTVLEHWLGWLWRFLPFPTAATGALVAVVVLNLRRSRAERIARRTIEAARLALSRTNQRLEERVAERTADLQETNAEVQRFAYIVSHDLRAPLVNIMGFTSELQVLRDTLVRGPADPATLADFDEALGFIRTSIGKMDRLINAILLLSRQGAQAVEPREVDVGRLLSGVADTLAHRIQSAGARIDIGPVPTLVGDPIGVEQIFSNLLDNAVKYLRPGVPGRIEVSARTAGRVAIFTIRDNGRGIAETDRTRVFDLFRRAGVQDQPGEGIGLAHVRAIVRRLGGSISLASTLGEGSTFTLILPLEAGSRP